MNALGPSDEGLSSSFGLFLVTFVFVTIFLQNNGMFEAMCCPNMMLFKCTICIKRSFVRVNILFGTMFYLGLCFDRNGISSRRCFVWDMIFVSKCCFVRNVILFGTIFCQKQWFDKHNVLLEIMIRQKQ